MTQAELKDGPERITLIVLARQELAEHGGNVKVAIQALYRRLNDQRHLLKEVVADAVYEAAENAVSYRNREVRRALMRPLKRESTKGAVIALARGIGASLLDFPMPDGSVLREAKPAAVQIMIERYEANGSDMLHKARWLRHLIQIVPADKTIGEIVTDERAKELWESTANA